MVRRVGGELKRRGNEGERGADFFAEVDGETETEIFRVNGTRNGADVAPRARRILEPRVVKRSFPNRKIRTRTKTNFNLKCLRLELRLVPAE